MVGSSPDTAAIPYVVAIIGGIALIGVAALALFWARRGHRRRAMIIIGCVIGLLIVGVLIAWHAALGRQTTGQAIWIRLPQVSSSTAVVTGRGAVKEVANGGPRSG